MDQDRRAPPSRGPKRVLTLLFILAAVNFTHIMDFMIMMPLGPQLMNLLTVYAPALTITQSPPHLDTLKDSLLIADGRHTLIRFHRDHARARLIVDDVHECTPHIQRFEEIVAAGGEPLSSSTLGL